MCLITFLSIITAVFGDKKRRWSSHLYVGHYST